MKRNYIYIVLAMLAISCNDYLDRPPLDMITDKEITFSEKEMELYVNKFYGNFPDSWTLNMEFLD